MVVWDRANAEFRRCNGTGLTTATFKVQLKKIRACSGVYDVNSCGDLTLPAAIQHGMTLLYDPKALFVVLENTGFKHSQCLRKLLPVLRLEYEAIVQGLQLSKISRASLYGWMAATLEFRPEALKYMPEEIITERLLSCRDKCPVVTTRFVLHMLELAGRKGVADKMRCDLPYEFTRIARLEQLRTQKSPWVNQLLTHCKNQLATFGNNSAHRNRYADSTMKWVSYFVTFISTFHSSSEACGDPIRSWFESADSDEVKKALVAFLGTRSVMNDRVRSAQTFHHCENLLTKLLRFFRHGFIAFMPNLDNMDELQRREILLHIDNKREAAHPAIRREYTNDEIEALIETAGNDTRMVLLLVILRDVGLRASAIDHLTFANLLDGAGDPRHVCTVREKGNTRRRFVTSDRLKQCIRDFSVRFKAKHPHISQQDLRPLYVSNPRDPHRPLKAKTLGRWLHSLASKAGIKDISVVPHAFRCTIVGRLLRAKNSMAVASRFLGHRTIATTEKHYWKSTLDALMDESDDPLAPEYVSREDAVGEKKQTLQLLLVKVIKGLQLIHAYGAHLEHGSEEDWSAKEVKAQILAQNPDLGRLVALVTSEEQPLNPKRRRVN